ncbi:YhcN/YlaJ family sporulation lipoprotein [Bacillus sp. EB600]|uniref:YhcN/YlaJ family sporulation lipoprotein n=1 Tax=Bacillus sp. EB600 TaxID=2806345 RepID=UPI00210AB7F7|nr:YhcN/YlaJ family sporulation lipoprotein [Bacillus sp. EB600]MCQ6279798.1 YhcN/YlaJ family sporulation lipoprotein [Bacillus sp. EB600]
MKKIFITAVVFFILSGCNTDKNVQKNTNQKLVNVKNSNIQEVDRKTGQEISKNLVELSTSVPNVDDATAVVLGRYAIVGIDVNSKIDRSQVGSIKYSVAEALRKDPHGANAVVVADPDTNQRLKNISSEIQKGRPIQGIMNELAEVAGRLMPEIPGNLVNPTPKTGTEDQKKKLPANEKNNLDKKQEEQSNHQKSERAR